MIRREQVAKVLRDACTCEECGCTDEAVDEVTAALNAKIEPEVARRVMGARELR